MQKCETASLPPSGAAGPTLAPRLLLPLPVQKRGSPTTVTIELRAADADGDVVTVSTALDVDQGDPRWQAWLVDAVAGQAKEGARRLRDEMLAQPGRLVEGFVPLAAVTPISTSDARPSPAATSGHTGS